MSKSSHKTSKKRCSTENWKLSTIQERECTEKYRFESQISKNQKLLSTTFIIEAMVRTAGNRGGKQTPLLSGALCPGKASQKCQSFFLLNPNEISETSVLLSSNTYNLPIRVGTLSKNPFVSREQTCRHGAGGRMNWETGHACTLPCEKQLMGGCCTAQGAQLNAL